MFYQRSLYQQSKTFVVMAVLLSGFLSAVTKAQTESDFKRQVPEIKEAITKIGTGATPEARADAAEHVADLTSGIISTWVGDKAFAELVSFLDIPEESVQFGWLFPWVIWNIAPDPQFLNFKNCCPRQIASRET